MKTQRRALEGELSELGVNGITVEASNPRPTDTGVDGAVDVDFDASLNGVEFSGEVTLVRHEQTGRYQSWGRPDHWLDGASVKLLRALPDDEFTAALSAIESAAMAAIDE